MDEVLNKLLKSELLSEETRAEVSKLLSEAMEANRIQVREEIAAEVRAELYEQWTHDMAELAEKVDSFVTEQLNQELSELKGDISRFRDVEAEFACKLVEEKHRLAGQVADELDQLVDKIDAFFEVRLAEEMSELKEDLEIVKQNEFGRKIFEAFADTFSTSHRDEKSAVGKLRASEEKLADLQEQLHKREVEMTTMIREAKMEQVLSQLSGKKREQMAMILRGVPTEKLEESYKHFIGRILSEQAAPATLNEAAQKTTVVKTGNSAGDDQVKPSVVNESLRTMLRHAGLSNE
jgi:hypothetical protein